MSRLLVGSGFFLCDAAATVMSILNCSGSLLILSVSLFSSILLTMISSTVRSVLWPTYFWDPPAGS